MTKLLDGTTYALLGVTRTIQLITPDEEELYGFPGRRNFMRIAMLINGVMYVSLIGVLAMAWGWLHRSDS